MMMWRISRFDSFYDGILMLRCVHCILRHILCVDISSLYNYTPTPFPFYSLSFCVSSSGITFTNQRTTLVNRKGNMNALRWCQRTRTSILSTNGMATKLKRALLRMHRVPARVRLHLPLRLPLIPEVQSQSLTARCLTACSPPRRPRC